MPKNPEIRKFETVARNVQKAIDILEAMPYEKNAEAALLGARKALWASENRISELKIHVQTG